MSDQQPDETIKIAEKPGFMAVGRRTGTSADIENIAFPTKCPPDIPSKSRIIAVCGATDFEDFASPDQDGWFFSDFYLFFHLLSPRIVGSSNQFWLTSEDPTDLVNKYKEYAHGDPRGERRIVLNDDLLEGIQQSGRLRVVHRNDLLERFLNTLREQAELAENSGEHLVIFIFGHGYPDGYGVAVGGNCETRHAPKLKSSHLKRILRQNANVTLFMTSCYSGGWFIQPSTDARTHINATAIAAAGPRQESLSWPLSASVGRACGSAVTSAILKSIMDIEDSESSGMIRGEATYISLAHAIHSTHMQIDSRYVQTQIHFAAQNDWWDRNYKDRIGVSMERFKEIWDNLPEVPVGDYGTGETSHGLAGSIRRATASRKRRTVEYLAYRYLTSNPGLSNSGHNIRVYSQCHRLLGHKMTISEEKIDDLYRVLQYRLAAQEQADELVKIMGLEMPNIFEYAVEEHEKTPAQWRTYNEVWDLILKKGLVMRPAADAGLEYSKPLAFICNALVFSELEWKEIVDRVEIAERFVRTISDQIYSLHGGDIIVTAPEVTRKRDEFMNTMRILGYRVLKRLPHFRR